MSWWNKDYKKHSDEKLMELICRKDESAFRELYQRYSNSIQRYCYRMLYQDKELASDATQEIFIRVYEKGIQFDAQHKFQTWLFSIAHNHCKNVYRSRSRRIQEILVENDSKHFEFSEESAEHFPTSQFQLALKSALQTLPEGQKNLFILRYQEAFSINEIAAITDTAEGTIKSGLHRTLKKLSKTLAPFHPKNLDL